MGKTNRKKEPPVRPVQKIELRDENNKGKIILVILLLFVGLGAIGYGMYTAFSTEKGWREIQANNTEEMNCSEDFAFVYNVGATGESPTAENKIITNLYSDLTVEAYKIFTSDMGYEDVNNIYYLNQHPNEEVVVPEALYDAFELLESYKNRNIYLAPIYMYYDDIFFCKEDYETIDFDPYVNEEIEQYYLEIASYANNPEEISIELLGNNTVRLAVSENYISFANENEITQFIDLHWMRNAFVTDYLAENLIGKGYTLGSISSYDGFSRCLDDSEETYALNIYDRSEESFVHVGTMNYTGRKSIVNLRSFAIHQKDLGRIYELKNGEVRTSYLDSADGKCKQSLDTLISYSDEKNCAETLLNMLPVFIAEEFNESSISNGNYVYCKDGMIYYNEDSIELSEAFYPISFIE